LEKECSEKWQWRAKRRNGLEDVRHHLKRGQLFEKKVCKLANLGKRGRKEKKIGWGKRTEIVYYFS